MTEDALERALVAAGHDPMAVSLLVYGADDVTERLGLAADLAEAYLEAVEGPVGVGVAEEDPRP